MKIFFFLLLSITCVKAQDNFNATNKYNNLSNAALKLYRNNDFYKAATSYELLFKKYDGKGTKRDKYIAACSWALTKNIEKAFYYLHEVVYEEKWFDLTYIISDNDLNILHKRERWDSLICKVKLNQDIQYLKFRECNISLLDSIYNDDQNNRKIIEILEKDFASNSIKIDSLWKEINYKDSVNLLTVRRIIDTYGWLSPKDIGEQNSKTLFLSIQHSNLSTLTKYFSKLKRAVKKSDASEHDLALMEDRTLILQGKPQIYGTQVIADNKYGKNRFYPIRNERNVNKRRLRIGLPSLEEYANFFGIKYVLPKK